MEKLMTPWEDAYGRPADIPEWAPGPLKLLMADADGPEYRSEMHSVAGHVDALQKSGATMSELVAFMIGQSQMWERAARLSLAPGRGAVGGDREDCFEAAQAWSDAAHAMAEEANR